MINVAIKDGRGRKNRTIVTNDQEFCVIQVPFPPIVKQKVQPFRQFLTDDGLSSGSNDMGVDGSTTNVDFWIPASTTADRYLTQVSIIVAYGTSGAPFEWADGTALTNGTLVFYNNSKGDIDIHGGIKTNQDVFRFIPGVVPTGWEVRHVNANNDFGYFINLNLSDFMPPYGIKLDKSSTQKLTVRIRDNVGADADTFNAIAYGFDRFE